MKRILTVALSIILFMVTVVVSSAVKIDGYDDGLEWQTYETDVEIAGKHGNNVNYAAMKHRYLNEYEVYVFLFLSDDSSETMDNAGFILDISDELTLTVTESGTRIKGDTSKYSVESKMAFVDDIAASCEIVVGFKHGVPEKFNASVSFIDGQGINSYFYPVSITSGVETVTQPHTTKPIKTTNPERTTKPEKTTKQKTTKNKVSTTKSEKSTSVKAKPQTTKAKKENKTVVYFYEKEVVVSQVIITEPFQTVIVTETVTQSETETEALTRQSDLTTGFVMQRVVVAAGILSLIVGGAIAGMSIKKSKSEENSSSDSESDEE